MLLVARCKARDCTLSGVVEGGSAWSFNLAGCSFVDFSASNLPEDGLLALAEVLKANTELTSLSLRHNSMSDDGVRALADALKINTALTVLLLGFNSIGNEGAKALAGALEVNSALTLLDLDSNAIGAEGASALADALKANSALVLLTLGSNPLDGDSRRAVELVLAVRPEERMHRYAGGSARGMASLHDEVRRRSMLDDDAAGADVAGANAQRHASPRIHLCVHTYASGSTSGSGFSLAPWSLVNSSCSTAQRSPNVTTGNRAQFAGVAHGASSGSLKS